MKTLNIGKIILDYRGNPAMIPGILENTFEKATIQEVLVRLVGMYNFNEDGKNGKRNIIGRRLGEKLFVCKTPTIELEDIEFDMVKESLSLRIFTCLIMGPVEEEIERAEKERG